MDAGSPGAAARRNRSVAWTANEEANVLRLHVLLGPRWSEIAQNLSGRTAIQVKSLWYGKLRAKSFRRRSLLGLYVRNLAALKEGAADSAAARNEAYELALKQHAATAAAISEAVGAAVDTDGGDIGEGSDDVGGSNLDDGAGLLCGGPRSTGAAEGFMATERAGAGDGGERRMGGEARAVGAAEWLLGPAMVPVPPGLLLQQQQQPFSWQQEQQQQTPSLPPLLKVEACNSAGLGSVPDMQQHWRQSTEGWAAAGAGFEPQPPSRAGGAAAAGGSAGTAVPHGRHSLAAAAPHSPAATRAIDGGPAWGPPGGQRGGGGSAVGAASAAACDGGSGWAADAFAMLTDDADVNVGMQDDGIDGWSDDGGATEALVDNLLLGGAAPMSLLLPSSTGLLQGDRRMERASVAAPSFAQNGWQASPPQLGQPPHQPLAFPASVDRALDAAGGRGMQRWPEGVPTGRASEPGLGRFPTPPRVGALAGNGSHLFDGAAGPSHHGMSSYRRSQPPAQPMRYSADGRDAWVSPPVPASKGRTQLGVADLSSWHSPAGGDAWAPRRNDDAPPQAGGRHLGDARTAAGVDTLNAGSLRGGAAMRSSGASPPRLQPPPDGGARYSRATPPRPAHELEGRGGASPEAGGFPAALRSWGLRELCFPEAWMPPAGPHWRYTAPPVPAGRAALPETAAAGDHKESPLEELFYRAGIPPPPEEGLARQLRHLNGTPACR
ncbi:hypothetical protein HYH03_006212 [Edaphochlamys debaryana]|uniref:Uncharacterized protein n=1 Tax=Edaphochlamys debaryana TaxID=47281 RepID=A0A836C175_9CHLO|nr:hypothetical protein HYH03_006212 [Edaphochlamys debaryana]|eukprot:KAG2495612.1 hypothetical protein HYH03_006212 [Edaphochlamys debaryana]